MREEDDLVRLGLTDPGSLKSLSLRHWDLLIRQGRRAGVLGRLQALLNEQELLDHVPSAPRNHLDAARLVACSQERVIRWEVYSIERALRSVQTKFVLLKGAAYILSQLPLARGRIQSDVDILVPKSKLEAVEKALLAGGWVHLKIEKYDQRYYRNWSHELPPLYHPDRATVLDVHHNILPDCGRLHPDPERLLQAAEPILGTPYTRLSAPDMVLHATAHMFQDGDLARALRELTDIDGLLRTFSGTSGFWEGLLKRAWEMDLHRPLFYGLRYTHEFLKTPIPSDVISRAQSASPPESVLSMMDWLVREALVPMRTNGATFSGRSARWLLYVRSHWLRMLPFMLARHLFHQSFRTR